MNRQSAVARYRASERSAPAVDHTFSVDFFEPYPRDTPYAFGARMRTIGYTYEQAVAVYEDSGRRTAGAEFQEGFHNSQPALHFVGFKGDEYTSAKRCFGEPDFFHRKNDVRFACGGELALGDTVVYANGSEKATYLFAVDDSAVM